nr:alpha/beta hydrolase [Dietzia alimentaria]
MVMADRDGVKKSSAPVTTLTIVGLASSMLNGLARVPFQRPWKGPAGVVDNVGQAVTRQAIRSFMGYSMGLPIDEFRSMEKVLDDLCRVVIPPFVQITDGVEITEDTIGGVHGIWCRAKASSDRFVEADDDKQTIGATLLYLHGGGYIGASPMMYAAFAAALVKTTGYEIFLPDYRLAPEFPFPAGVLDATAVYQGLLSRGVEPGHIVVAGDSGGGGLTTSLLYHLHQEAIPSPAAVALFSPELELGLNYPSMTENAPFDILPWNVPVAPYLHGVQPDDARVSVAHAELDPQWFPPTFVCWGEKEIFRDAIADFATRLQSAGIPVHAIEEPGMFHVFPILMPWGDPAKRVLRTLADLAERYVRADATAEQTH